MPPCRRHLLPAPHCSVYTGESIQSSSHHGVPLDLPQSPGPPAPPRHRGCGRLTSRRQRGGGPQGSRLREGGRARPRRPRRVLRAMCLQALDAIYLECPDECLS